MPSTTQADPSSPMERRIVSVLFADLVGFTPLAERLDSEDVATIQDAYFAAVRATVERYHGVLEKFIGDAAMAVFGIPAGRDDDAERAVRAGLALIGAVEQLGARLGLAPGELQLRVGVNSGEVVHAVSGPDAGRVTGDTVNTAARLQTAAPPGRVLLGELTALAVAAAVETEPMGTVELKGKAEPVRCFLAIGPRPEPSREKALGELRAPFLARTAELDRIRRLVAGSMDPPRAMRLVVIAPPGVGKSRLLAEVAGTVEASVLRARVRPQATAPYETVVQLIRAAGPMEELPDRLAAAGVDEARAAVVAAEVATLLGTAAAPGTPAPEGLAAERERRFDAWITAIDALTPTTEAWLVEDVHWAGGDLLAFLDRAGRAPTRHGRAVVATARPGLLDAAPAWCDGAERLDLGPLEPVDAAGLVHALIGPALPQPLVEAIVSRSDGTPLFIEELIRTWAAVGTLVRDGGTWMLAVDPGAVPFPATVQAIYAAQLDDLPPDARLVVRRGAVAGRRVPTAALPSLGVDGTDGLERLRRRALFDGPVDDEITGEAYAYRHALLRDAGYASLARLERARLHLAMAAWLIEVAGEQPAVVAEAIAEHYADALDALPALVSDDLPSRSSIAADAAAWYERAGEAAAGLAATDAAIRLLGRGVELTSDEDVDALGRRRLRLGEILAASADLDAGIAQLELAHGLGSGGPPARAASAYTLGRAYMQQIRFGEAERVVAEALADLPDAPESHRARLHALHAWARAAQGQSGGVAEEATRARSMAAAAGDPALELDVMEHVAAARDEVDEGAIAEWPEIESRARALGRWPQVVTAARIHATQVAADDPVAAIGRLAEVSSLARTHGLTEQGGWTDYARCELLWVTGDWDEALALGSRTLDVAEANGYERLAFRTFMVLLPLAAARRDAAVGDRYRGWWPSAAAHFPTTVSAYGQMLTAATEVWMARASGGPDPTPDPAVVSAVLAMANPHVHAAVETLAEAWADAGRIDLAAETARRIVEDSSAADATPLMRASSALVAATARLEPADSAVGLARAAGAPWWEARALRLAGRAAEAAPIEASLGIRPTEP